MSAECNVCGHDLSPDGIGLAPCGWCKLKRERDLFVEALREMLSFTELIEEEPTRSWPEAIHSAFAALEPKLTA